MSLSNKEIATTLTGVDNLTFNIAAHAEDFLDTLSADVKSGVKTVIKGELVFQKDNSGGVWAWLSVSNDLRKSLLSGR